MRCAYDALYVIIVRRRHRRQHLPPQSLCRPGPETCGGLQSDEDTDPDVGEFRAIVRKAIELLPKVGTNRRISLVRAVAPHVTCDEELAPLILPLMVDKCAAHPPRLLLLSYLMRVLSCLTQSASIRQKVVHDRTASVR